MELSQKERITRTPKPVKKSTVAVAALREKQEQRTALARAIDASRQHHLVISRRDPRVSTWMNSPGRMDVEGIDTKKSLTTPKRLPSKLRMRIARPKPRLKR